MGIVYLVGLLLSKARDLRANKRSPMRMSTARLRSRMEGKRPGQTLGLPGLGKTLSHRDKLDPAVAELSLLRVV